MPIIPLVQLSDVLSELAGSLPPNVSSVPQLILAASRAIQRWTMRDIGWYFYDEYYNGNGYAEMMTRQRPINRIHRISIQPTGALRVSQQNYSLNQRATVEAATIGDVDTGLFPVGLTLRTIASGVSTTYGFFYNTPPAFTFTASAGGTGGSIAPGTYLCAFALAGSSGESVPCVAQSVSVASGQTITFAGLPIIPTNATSYSLYVSSTNGNVSTLTRQAAGVPPGTFALSSVSSGSSPTSASNVTVAALASNINALNAGWSAAPVPNFSLYPTSDFVPLTGTQNALANTSSATCLQMMGSELSGYQPNFESGQIAVGQLGTSGSTYSLVGWGGIGGGYFPAGFQNIRVEYDAGYVTIPADVQQACMITIQDWLWRLQKVRIFKSESTYHYKYEFFDRTGWGLPDEAKSILEMGRWREFRRY
jgi:hypothetical protein